MAQPLFTPERIPFFRARQREFDNSVDNTLRVLPLHDQFSRIHSVLSDNVSELFKVQNCQLRPQLTLALFCQFDWIEYGRRSTTALTCFADRPWRLNPARLTQILPKSPLKIGTESLVLSRFVGDNRDK